MQLNLQINPGDIAKVKLMLGAFSKSVNTVIQQSVNQTLSGVRTDETDEISKILNLTKTNIRKSITVKRMTSKDGTAWVSCKGKPLNLYHFQARQTQKGVTFKVMREGPRVLIEHAFITKIKNNLVAERLYEGQRKPWRKGKGGKGKWYGNLPSKGKGNRGQGTDYRFPGGHLHFLTTLRIPDVLGDITMEKISELADARLTKNLNNRLDYELSKLK